ncbi:Signal recognition particle receptor FtsY [Rickettsiales endosymbiont of Paramecium tredecaurelia]|uniref:signal recognition particle-docking protein FtsY n=1 Tax=Candidatus Sarmatiella mevalonica TaxID=2770581 RepID=UPI0019233118|nr:signaling recognition particle receptor family protein [Candidatus Sarmatiella mevalonica]MBL3284976.1 Signal recognition particle receptor FtsY [Candidatus Sarmatiella mevalonica]
MFSKLKQVFSKPDSFFSRVSQLFSTSKIDQAFLDQLYENLIFADFGHEFSSALLLKFKALNYNSDLDGSTLLNKFKELIALELDAACITPEQESDTGQNMKIIMLCGVNGNGKTTTIGKLANIFQQENRSHSKLAHDEQMRGINESTEPRAYVKLSENLHIDGDVQLLSGVEFRGWSNKVVVGACDTFRAAAKEQLKLWVANAGGQLIEGKEGADPSSVAYSAVDYGLRHGNDVVMLDTAGRLHNKKNLMDELVKINKVIRKLAPNARHERWLVLDASTGQNAIDQVSFFKEAIDVNGLVITKLDGTGRAGFAVHLMKKFGIPIKYLCTGEGMDDISSFNLAAFLDAMFS